MKASPVIGRQARLAGRIGAVTNTGRFENSPHRAKTPEKGGGAHALK